MVGHDIIDCTQYTMLPLHEISAQTISVAIAVCTHVHHASTARNISTNHICCYCCLCPCTPCFHCMKYQHKPYLLLLLSVPMYTMLPLHEISAQTISVAIVVCVEGNKKGGSTLVRDLPRGRSFCKCTMFSFKMFNRPTGQRTHPLFELLICS